MLAVVPDTVGAGLGRGDVFSIRVNADEIGEFNAYDISLRYATAILTATGVNILPVLGQTFIELIPTVVDDSTGSVRVVAGIPSAGRVTVTGSEPLFQVNFRVDDPGTTNLDLVNDKITLGGELILHATRGGVFTTTGARPPVASFTFSPSNPIQGQVVSFDASGSSDPDGKVVSYFWRWGEPDPGTDTTPNPVITHIFRDRLGTLSHGSFTVTLIVTDDSGFTGRFARSINVARLPFRDLLIGEFQSASIRTNPGKPVKLSVTVVNSGTFDETLGLTILVESTRIASTENIQLAPFQTSDFAFDWNTTLLAPDVYKISANVTALRDEAIVYSSDAVYDTGEPVIIGEILVGAAVKGDPKIRFVDFDNSGGWALGETVFYDINENNEFDLVDPTIRAGSTTLTRRDDINIRFVDLNDNNVWDTGEPIIHDRNANFVYDTGEPIIAGTTPAGGKPTKDDILLKFVDADNSLAWTLGEVVWSDTDKDDAVDSGEPVANPHSDPNTKFADFNNNNNWNFGEKDFENNSSRLEVQLVAESSSLSASLIVGSGVAVIAIVGVLVLLLRRWKRKSVS